MPTGGPIWRSTSASYELGRGGRARQRLGPEGGSLGASSATRPEVFPVGVEQKAGPLVVCSGWTLAHPSLQPRLSLHFQHLCLTSVSLAVLSSPAFGLPGGDSYGRIRVFWNLPLHQSLALGSACPYPQGFLRPLPPYLMHSHFLAHNVNLHSSAT